ncbi:hypothetical protein KOAAANKH_00709 [Brevundimonas sp. NIBR10]|nr:hypothetical protein KOAAANKH_00709 [Brevundimonas sp. NIBR10]
MERFGGYDYTRRPGRHVVGPGWERLCTIQLRLPGAIPRSPPRQYVRARAKIPPKEPVLDPRVGAGSGSRTEPHRCRTGRHRPSPMSLRAPPSVTAPGPKRAPPCPGPGTPPKSGFAGPRTTLHSACVSDRPACEPPVTTSPRPRDHRTGHARDLSGGYLIIRPDKIATRRVLAAASVVDPPCKAATRRPWGVSAAETPGPSPRPPAISGSGSPPWSRSRACSPFRGRPANGAAERQADVPERLRIAGGLRKLPPAQAPSVYRAQSST